jgi:hypothetical protein
MKSALEAFSNHHPWRQSSPGILGNEHPLYSPFRVDRQIVVVRFLLKATTGFRRALCVCGQAHRSPSTNPQPLTR